MSGAGPGIKVVVIGGSIGGLSAALALRSVGCDVDVYERASGPMVGRGAGIVVQQDLLHLLQRCGALELPATGCELRRYLMPEGGEGVATRVPQRFTSWGAIHRTLRSAFPDQRYHQGSSLAGLEQEGRRVVARLAERAPVEADLVLCADGSRSEVRRRLLPQVEPVYAGYVAWRGTLEEELADAGLVRFFDGAFTFCESRSGGHILCYVIPGHDAAKEPGRRLLNWVWYVPLAKGPAVERLLVDRTGKRHPGSVPAGMVPDDLIAELHAAAHDLHWRFAELVRTTPQPFIQVIIDVAVPQMAFGRVCLMGDAAFVLRPHAAAATAKAAADADALADALAAHPGNVDAALRSWQDQRLEQGRRLVEHAASLGRRTVGSADAVPVPRALTPAAAAERFAAIAMPP